MAADPVVLALNHASNVRLAVDLIGSPEANGEGFLRRAKDFPALYSSVGLVAALTFYMSKSDEDLFPHALMLVSKGPQGCDSKGPSLGALKGELGSKEGAGYTIMLAAVVDAVYKLAGEELLQGLEDPCSLGNGQEDLFLGLAKSLKTLRESGREEIVGQFISEYLVELKKAAEALLGGD